MEDDRSFFLKLAAEEVEKAKRLISRAARERHRQLAEFYAARARGYEWVERRR